MSRIAQLQEALTSRLTQHDGFTPAGGTETTVLRRDDEDRTYLVAFAPAHNEQALLAARHTLTVCARSIALLQWPLHAESEGGEGSPQREIVCIILAASAGGISQRQMQMLGALVAREGRTLYTVWLADLGRHVLTTDQESVGTPLAKAVAQAMPAERKPWATYLFLFAIVALWVLISAYEGSFNATEEVPVLVRWGAASRPDLYLDGETWRFFTANWLHIGILHLAMNSVGLYTVGLVVESLFGPGRMVYIFLVAGVFGSAFSAMWGPPFAASAGASGAIFGLLGAVLYFRFASPLGDRIALKPLIRVLLINLAIGLGLYFIVDNWNHLGGFVGGMIAAAAVGAPAVEGMRQPRLHMPAAVRGIVVTALALLTAAVPVGLLPVPGAAADVATGINQADEGDLASAEQVFRRTLARQETAYGHYLLAFVLLHQQKCAEALTHIDQSLREVPGEPNLRLLRQEILACMNP